MLATPRTLYIDNPGDNLLFLTNLGKEETTLYTMGYIQACFHVQEAFSESRRRFLNAALDKDDREKQRLLSYVKLLDSLDKTVTDRVFLLQESLDIDEEEPQS